MASCFPLRSFPVCPFTHFPLTPFPPLLPLPFYDLCALEELLGICILAFPFQVFILVSTSLPFPFFLFRSLNFHFLIFAPPKNHFPHFHVHSVILHFAIFCLSVR